MKDQVKCPIQKVNEIARCPKAQFLVTAYQGLMLVIFLSVLIGYGEAL